MNGAIRRGYNHWWFAIDTLPVYMKKNLQEMPNNKGYRWKGVTFYGYLPEMKDHSTIIFEKIQGELIIHEYAINGTYNRTIKQKSLHKDIVNKDSKKTYDGKNKNTFTGKNTNDSKKTYDGKKPYDGKKTKKQTGEKMPNQRGLLKNNQNGDKQGTVNTTHKFPGKKRLLVNKS